jgi:adenylate cyclase
MKKQHSNYIFSSARPGSLIVALVVMLLGIVSAGSPFGEWLEEDIGLPWLFQLRGERPAPRDVAIISIDQDSAKILGLPAKPRKWPRHYHGQLVEKLAAHGASAIGFDIIFDEQKNPQHNRQFADGMIRANNVVLFQYIRQEEAIDTPGGISHGRIERLISPIPILANSAQGLSPFPLPKVPAKVNHFILYKESLGDLPTLPVTMLQLHASQAHAELIELINLFEPTIAHDLWQTMGTSILNRHRHGGIQNIAREFRSLFNRKPELASKITSKLEHTDSKHKLLLEALLNIYTCQKSLYLNFYGSFGSIKTIPYHKVLSSDPTQPTIDVAGKAVFVGFSEQFQPEQKDGFYTVFTDEDSGSDISGVEIIATAFANLLEGSAIALPGLTWNLFILLGWGLLVSQLLRLGSATLQILITVLLALVYSSIVYASFVQYHLWLPFMTPVLLQLVLASLLTFVWKYRQVQRERAHIREAFGYHLPVNVVDQIVKGVNHVTGPGEKLHGVVMATDAQQYTALSEKLRESPDRLHNLMNDYYQCLFKPIRSNDGIISDVVGDAAMAIWASTDETASVNSSHQKACLAALAARQAIETFNQSNPEHALPTRFGLDSGEIVMGHVGALDHYEYRAIGDIVNTASRIEGVNKLLGTRIILSEAVLSDTSELFTRELGQFKLMGKTRPTTLHELLGLQHDRPKFNQTMFDDFAKGLDLFRAQNWQEAYKLFQSNPDDGPSHYYASLCQQYLTDKPADFEGYIELAIK